MNQTLLKQYQTLIIAALITTLFFIITAIILTSTHGLWAGASPFFSVFGGLAYFITFIFYTHKSYIKLGMLDETVEAIKVKSTPATEISFYILIYMIVFYNYLFSGVGVISFGISSYISYSIYLFAMCTILAYILHRYLKLSSWLGSTRLFYANKEILFGDIAKYQTIKKRNGKVSVSLKTKDALYYLDLDEEQAEWLITQLG